MRSSADGDRSLARRAEDLLRLLTLPEKIAMLHQRSPGVPRLRIPPFRTGTEALHGAAWLGPATVFPQPVGMGATWDPDLVRAVGAAVGEEVRALHHRNPEVSLNVWAPVVNLLRDPRWGRNEEGYSEDPLLTGRMAVAYCRGLCGEHPTRLRTGPLLKHFLAYNNETDRDTTSSALRPRVLHEYDLPPFRAAIAAGVAVGVMPAYNLVNGRPNHVSPYLARLRRWTRDELIVCSDAEAPSNLVDTEHYFEDHPSGHAAALRAGVDSFTDHGEDSSVTIGRITEALDRGLLAPADVDRAVRRLLLLRLRLGELDNGHPSSARADGAALDSPAHRELARRAARRAIVLLKNEGALLPLQLPAGERVAVIGPLADTVCEDWYSGTMPYRITVAAGLGDALRERDCDISVALGVDRVALLPEPAPGQDSRTGAAEAGRFDVFDWGEGVVTLRSIATGLFLTVKDDGSLVADQQRPNGWVVRETFRVEPAPGLPGPAGRSPAGLGRDAVVVLRSTATGRYVSTDQRTGELAATAPDPATAQRLCWHVLTDGVAEAVRATRGAGTVVVVVGNDPLINGRETQDRTTLALPPAQDRLVRAACQAHHRVVLLVMSSYPYAVTWAQGNVPAIAWTCHAGQETGRAVADVLLGEASPSGRLPQTWYAFDADLPPLLDYDIIKARRTYLYSGSAPLYPFGHGLSYTSFAYSGLRLKPAVAGPGDTVTLTVDVANTGPREGAEVVQVYVRARDPRHERPLRELREFSRVTLQPDETRTVTLCLPVKSLAFWDVAAHRMTVDPGDYEVMVGGSSAAIAQSAPLAVRGDRPRSRPFLGIGLDAADFDDYDGVTLVDATRSAGDAVTPLDGTAGWIMFRAADLGPAAGLAGLTVTARVAREEPGIASLEVWCDDPARGQFLGAVAVPCTGGRYAWAEVTAPLVTTGGVRDVYVVLRGPQRLAWLRVAAPAERGRPERGQPERGRAGGRR